MERAQLMELTRHFLDAFDRNDLDAAISGVVADLPRIVSGDQIPKISTPRAG